MDLLRTIKLKIVLDDMKLTQYESKFVSCFSLLSNKGSILNMSFYESPNNSRNKIFYMSSERILGISSYFYNLFLIELYNMDCNAIDIFNSKQRSVNFEKINKYIVHPFFDKMGISLSKIDIIFNDY